mgnify:CR=1 FL=1
MWLPWMEFAAVLTVATLLTIPMGQWLARCFTSERHGWLERLSYRAMGVNPQERMGWKRYGAALVLSNALMMLLGYLLLRLQGALPLNPLEIAAQAPDLAFNTAASFITNTNWQAYAGENSLSNATQMVVITFLMFAGATTGVAAGAGFVRGLARSSSQDLGNYWVDYVRVFWRVLLPLSFTRLAQPLPGRQVLRPETARKVRDMLVSVTQPGGTATRAQVLGYTVGGKTGTSRKLENGRYVTSKYVASFAGFVPASRPRLIAAVMLDEPDTSGGQYYGGISAAPVFSRVMAGSLRVLGIEPDAPTHNTLLPADMPVVKEET